MKWFGWSENEINTYAKIWLPHSKPDRNPIPYPNLIRDSDKLYFIFKPLSLLFLHYHTAFSNVEYHVNVAYNCIHPFLIWFTLSLTSAWVIRRTPPPRGFPHPRHTPSRTRGVDSGERVHPSQQKFNFKHFITNMFQKWNISFSSISMNIRRSEREL